MAAKFEIGDYVTWNSEARQASGKIIKVHTKDIEYEGHTTAQARMRRSMKSKSDKSDHIATNKESEAAARYVIHVSVITTLSIKVLTNKGSFLKEILSKESGFPQYTQKADYGKVKSLSPYWVCRHENKIWKCLRSVVHDGCPSLSKPCGHGSPTH